MRNQIENLMEITRPKSLKTSLPFVFTTKSGERKNVWFTYEDSVKDDVFEARACKIFVLSDDGNIETINANIYITTTITVNNSERCSRREYIEKFNEQFVTNQFDDVLELLSMAEASEMIDLYEEVIEFLKQPKVVKCKHCGSTEGFYTKLTGVQYYTNTGDTDGYNVDVQGVSAYCRKCDKIIGKIADLVRV